MRYDARRLKGRTREVSRIVLIEDDPTLRENLASLLIENHFTVEAVASATAGLDAALSPLTDFAIVDLQLPDGSGFDIIRALRRSGCSYPILILTAVEAWEARVEGLEAGADDCVPKPIRIEELLARINALRRRASFMPKAILKFGDYTLDSDSKRFFFNGAAVHLTSFEFRLLELLMRSPGKVLSADRLKDGLYGDDEGRHHNGLQVILSRIRDKLEPGKPIVTKRGSGYCWAIKEDGKKSGCC
jgi:two-component system response regulator PhoP